MRNFSRNDVWLLRPRRYRICGLPNPSIICEASMRCRSEHLFRESIADIVGILVDLPCPGLYREDVFCGIMMRLKDPKLSIREKKSGCSIR